MRTVVLALGLALAVGPAYATDTSGNPPAVTDPVVCKISPRANSRIPRRVCRKKSDWEALAEGAAKDFREVQSRPITPLCPPAGC